MLYAGFNVLCLLNRFNKAVLMKYGSVIDNNSIVIYSLSVLLSRLIWIKENRIFSNNSDLTD